MELDKEKGSVTLLDLSKLFDNPIIIAILLGVISTVFGKLKGSNEENQKKVKPKKHAPKQKDKNARPTLQQATKSNERKISGRSVQERTSSRSRSPKAVSKDLATDIEQRQSFDQSMASLHEQQQKIETKLEQINSVTNQSGNDIKDLELNEKIKKSHSLHFNQKSVVDGVILAEILGPPRAKRPHQYQTYHQK